MDVAERLVEYAVSISYKDLPKEAIDAAKKVILDLSGVIIVGSSSCALYATTESCHHC